ncbi:helix-turn-helix domain-containing protein [Microbacterium resistens]
MWDAKMTQTALAARLGFTQSGLSKKLHGRTGWSIDELGTVARELNSSISYLVGEVEDPHPASPSRGRMVGPAGIEPTTSTV